ncbi:hypothetical protein [Aminobacter sp. LjRoot7]|uniref:hypothetical protein n=1 Tax=Aminobacter sp. LjRoot7 TaxID=3342335 RepID=UPI003ECC2790
MTLAKILDPALLVPLVVWLWLVRNIALQLIGAVAVAIGYSALGLELGFSNPALRGESIAAAVLASLTVTLLFRFAYTAAPIITEWFCREPLRRRIGIGLLLATAVAATIAPGAILLTKAQQKALAVQSE